MESATPISQKIRKVYDQNMIVAMKYYGIVALLNGIHLTQRKIELLAFTALKGTISAGGAREEFVKRFSSSKATANNIIAELLEMKLLVKQGKKTVVHPQITLDFTKPLQLTLNLSAHAAD